MFTIPTARPTTARSGTAGSLADSLLGDLARSTGGPTFAVHHLAPRALGSPVHTHRHHDEWSYVICGLVGVRVGGLTVTARAGDVVLKPRGVPHAFWNAGTAPARFLEVIAADGFSDYFTDLGATPEAAASDGTAVAEIARRYGVDVDLTSVAALVQEHGLVRP